MDLSAAQMAAMSRLLDEALPLDTAGRRRWLENLPPEHAGLAAALRYVLLQISEQTSGAGRFATLPKIGAVLDEAPTGTAGLQPGARVGPYQLVRWLATGGMARVWLAQRADGAFKREVALKLPMLSGLRPDLAQRFAHERDILASLEHVNIARFYDAGVSPDGLPYLAMEYVPGKPLTAWCDAHRLGLRERIKLFLQVLDAVRYAHARQVIHRDLKPSNILVTESGQVRLLDFGVAKLLAEPDEHTQLTQVYGAALTPDYAPPELVRGEAEAVSDIYSLGVVLYQLLTGGRPYRIKAGGSAAELERAIATVRIERPSTHLAPEAGSAQGTTQQRLARRLRGDLDAIVLKALSRDPEQRYAGASALADDLQRHLSDEPVAARPARLPYRAGKFLLRHRAGAATAVGASFVVLVAVGLVLSRPPTGVPPGVSATTARVSEKSIAVLPFVDMSEKKDQEYFADGIAEEILGLLTNVSELHVVARTSAFSFKGKSDDIPTIARKLLVANVLEGSVRKSGGRLRITAELVRADNGYHLWSQTYDRNLGDIFKVQDEIAGAVVKALKLSLLAEAMPKARGTENFEAYTLYLQSLSLFLRAATQADWEKMVDYLRQALKLDPTFAPAWAWLSSFRSAQALFGWVPARQGYEEARRAARQALALDPKLPEAHSAMAIVHIFYDWDWPGAQAQVQQAVELNPGNADASYWAGFLARILGHDEDALRFLQRAVANDPLNAFSYVSLGFVRYWTGRLSEAKIAIRKGLDLNPGHPYGHWLAGQVMVASGDPTAALAEFERDNDARQREEGRAIAYYALGRKVDADLALADVENRYAGSDAYGIAEIHAFRGEIDQAFAWLDRAYRQRDFRCVWAKGDPLLKSVKPDPRYKAFLRKMNLPE
jgi:serine/threonine protein kinase/TolB-like protein/Tfp pilus assembly protein PilF